MSLWQDYRQTLQHLLDRVEFHKNSETISHECFMETAIAEITECHHKVKKVIWIGNGGSAAIASHGAIDFWKNGGIRSISFNEASLLTCTSNDYGYHAVFQMPIEMFAEQGDILIAMSSSGQSQNILNGVKAAKEKKCTVITLSGFLSNNPLRCLGDLNAYVPSMHYGHVELSHGIIAHFLLDLLLTKSKGHKEW